MSEPAALATFADVASAIQAEFASAPATAVRDLVLARYAAEVALQAGDLAEMGKCQRTAMRIEAGIREALRRQKRDGSGSSSLRAKLEARYAGSRLP